MIRPNHYRAKASDTCHTVMHTLGIIALGLASALLCGCGVTYKRVNITPMEIITQLETLDSSYSVNLDLVCPGHNADEIAFVYLVRRTPHLASDTSYYYSKQQQVTSAIPRYATCPGLGRGVEALTTLFTGPHWPSAEWTHRRTVFVRIVSDNALYRISAEGASARVEFTDLETPMRTLPTSLDVDLYRIPRGEEIMDAIDRFYNTIHWEPTNKVTVSHMQRTDDGGISSMTITIRR